MSDWNQSVIEEFRANGGKVAQFGDAPVVILHTIGAKSGEQRDIPLVALVGDEGQLTVFASKGGAPTNPDWYHNLKANPVVEVEVGTKSFMVRADELTDAARRPLWSELLAASPSLREYEAKTARHIPVFTLTRRP